VTFQWAHPVTDRDLTAGWAIDGDGHSDRMKLIASISDTQRMPEKKPGPSVKKPKTYEALRDKGMTKERAARISNAQARKEKS
jgi:hypothetical protein